MEGESVQRDVEARALGGHLTALSSVTCWLLLWSAVFWLAGALVMIPAPSGRILTLGRIGAPAFFAAALFYVVSFALIAFHLVRVSNLLRGAAEADPPRHLTMGLLFHPGVYNPIALGGNWALAYARSMFGAGFLVLAWLTITASLVPFFATAIEMMIGLVLFCATASGLYAAATSARETARTAMRSLPGHLQGSPALHATCSLVGLVLGSALGCAVVYASFLLVPTTT